MRRTPNAGSFFKNPILDVDAVDRLRAQIGDVPTYPDANGIKVAAARLIGYAQATYAARDETLEANEASALARAHASAAAAVDAADFARQRADGATLRDTAIAALAFGHDDA